MINHFHQSLFSSLLLLEAHIEVFAQTSRQKFCKQPLLRDVINIINHNKMAMSKLTKTSINFITKPANTIINIRLFSEKDSHKSSNESTPTLQDDNEEIVDPHLPPWPNGINPHTGERGGPRGPEPTRYGDWERKGRVSDF